MKKIIYSRPDGGVNIVHPCGTIEESWDRLPDNAINPQIVEEDAIIPDRTFRNAWEADSGSIKVNMDKARGIHMDRIRQARDQRLEALDKETVQALGKKDDAKLAEIEAQKQVLRDIPQTLDLSKAASPDELKIIWPREL